MNAEMKQSGNRGKKPEKVDWPIWKQERTKNIWKLFF